MEFDLIHPREQLAMLMHRVYRYGMTTTSGGNMSIRDDNGDIWITPAGVDKGTLTWDDVVLVKSNGQLEGKHRPSSEFPFHCAIYEARPDLQGIVHAHPCALVSFSIVRKIPPTSIIPQAREICGTVGFARYALPGSELLGNNIAETFKQGFDSILMENHGVVCGGRNVLDAFHRFETLDFCARLVIRATILGGYRELQDDQIALLDHQKHFLPEFDLKLHTNQERELRKHIKETVHRAYDQQLMTSTEGVISVRLDNDSFLITPTGKDRRLLDISDIVLIRHCQRERGKLPSRSVLLHDRIYKDHPYIHSIISAQAPNATAFSVASAHFDTKTIPESYILLRKIPRIPYGAQYLDEREISRHLDRQTPVILMENDAILTTGKSLLEAFDRLEVAEFSARSLIDASLLGGMIAMDDAQTRELEAKFF
ncbi:MAG: class II aldolase/adducin family protein [candidate division KSB1 bacterium]|nr:class II aldolase/adducin family protein [candidate division KSB1 bacterium]